VNQNYISTNVKIINEKCNLLSSIIEANQKIAAEDVKMIQENKMLIEENLSSNNLSSKYMENTKNEHLTLCNFY
jgi:translation initiation factor 6 (eIF-6)